MKIVFLGLFTVLAFAGNSLLNKAALASGFIDPWSFSMLRIVSAALFLVCLYRPQRLSIQQLKQRITPALFLCAYVVFFSLAYLHLTSATGALILFACVQFILVAFSFWRGDRLTIIEWLGLVLAFVGVVLLLLPGIEQPSLWGFLLMLISGVGWACFTLFGLTSKDAIADVTVSFCLAVPLVMMLWLFALTSWQFSILGAVLAIASGVMTSGLGYYVWFLLLPKLTASSAAVFQLSVPPVVALLGVVFLAERLTIQIVGAISIVIAGLALYTFSRQRRNQVKLSSSSSD